MKKRYVAACILVVVVLILLLPAVTRRRRSVEHNGYRRFKVVEEYKDGWEVVDTDTGYSYFMLTSGETVPIFDEYGDPYRANGWRDYGT